MTTSLVRYGNIPSDILIISGKWCIVDEGTPNQSTALSCWVIDPTDEAAIDSRILPGSITGYKHRANNVPLTGLKLYQTDRYSVILPSNYWYDIEYDVVYETLSAVGCRAGGYLNGEFIFGRTNSRSMQLIRIGSPLYESLVVACDRASKPKIKDLIPGHIYRTRGDKEFVFIGLVDTVIYDGRSKQFMHKYNYQLWSGSDRSLSWSNLRYHKAMTVIDDVGVTDIPDDIYQTIREDVLFAIGQCQYYRYSGVSNVFVRPAGEEMPAVPPQYMGIEFFKAITNTKQ